jgi:hypothetical protein
MLNVDKPGIPVLRKVLHFCTPHLSLDSAHFLSKSRQSRNESILPERRRLRCAGNNLPDEVVKQSFISGGEKGTIESVEIMGSGRDT